MRLGTSRDRRCRHHATETPLHACTAIRVPRYHSVRKVKKLFIVILIPKPTKFPERLVAGSDSAFFVAVQQQSCSSQEIQPSTWLRIASLHLAETLRPTALPHGSAPHLYITCRLLLCVRLGMSRDRRCGHHAAETALHACTAVRVLKYHSVRKVKKIFMVILIPKPSLNFRTG